MRPRRLPAKPTSPALGGRKPTAVGALLALAVALAPAGTAQGTPAIQRPQDITFDLIATAMEMRTYEMDQVRRFRDPGGNLVGLRERLLHHHDGSSEAFRLDFLGLESGSTLATSASAWQTTYVRQSGLLKKHGSFSVHDPAAARQNYILFWLGSTVRQGRSVERIVVLPRLLDRSIWILDLDRVTGLVLYSGEFDTSARLVNELEVVQLRLGGEVRIPETPWAWNPWMIVTEHATFADARRALGSEGGAMVQPDPARLPQGYALRNVRVVENPLNGNRSLVMTYGDGVDTLFVLETQDNLEVFTGLPVASSASAREHRVAYFQDSSLGAYLFQEGPVRFLVVGRGALSGLRSTVEGIYRQLLGR